MDGTLTKTTFIFMLIFAIFADIASFFISLIPFAGQLLNPILALIVVMTLWLWLAFKGLGFQGGIASGASMIVEIIPILQVLPTFTLMVVVIYLKSKVKSVVPISKKVALVK